MFLCHIQTPNFQMHRKVQPDTSRRGKREVCKELILACKKKELTFSKKQNLKLAIVIV